MSLNLLTIREAVLIIEEKTGKPLSPRQLRHEIQLNRLKAVKMANTYFIDPGDLDKYTRRNPGPKKGAKSQKT